MKKDITKMPADVADEKLFDNWFDPVETELRTKVRGFIEAMIAEEWRRRSPVRATDASQGCQRETMGARRLPATGTGGEYAR